MVGCRCSGEFVHRPHSCVVEGPCDCMVRRRQQDRAANRHLRRSGRTCADTRSCEPHISDTHPARNRIPDRSRSCGDLRTTRSRRASDWHPGHWLHVGIRLVDSALDFHDSRSASPKYAVAVAGATRMGPAFISDRSECRCRRLSWRRCSLGPQGPDRCEQDRSSASSDASASRRGSSSRRFPGGCSS